ncbi:MAG TPA: hypothetical protein VNX28_05380 [Gemmataceae bacterium]|nr:hypothetical protein [Gemmataceae bacterium]
MTDNVQPGSPAPGASNKLLLVISWIWVGIPLVWGVLETVRTSLPLFH